MDSSAGQNNTNQNNPTPGAAPSQPFFQATPVTPQNTFTPPSQVPTQPLSQMPNPGFVGATSVTPVPPVNPPTEEQPVNSIPPTPTDLAAQPLSVFQVQEQVTTPTANPISEPQIVPPMPSVAPVPPIVEMPTPFQTLDPDQIGIDPQAGFAAASVSPTMPPIDSTPVAPSASVPSNPAEPQMAPIVNQQPAAPVPPVLMPDMTNVISPEEEKPVMPFTPPAVPAPVSPISSSPVSTPIQEKPVEPAPVPTSDSIEAPVAEVVSTPPTPPIQEPPMPTVSVPEPTSVTPPATPVSFAIEPTPLDPTPPELDLSAKDSATSATSSSSSEPVSAPLNPLPPPSMFDTPAASKNSTTLSKLMEEKPKEKKTGGVGSKLKKAAAGGSKVAPLMFAALALGFGIFFFVKYQNEANRAQELVAVHSNQVNGTEELINTISKLVLLPNEKPTVATVSDSKKLVKKGILADAQNGDKLLVYQDAQKAVLFRPGVNKIIAVEDIAPSTEDVAGASTESAPTPTQALSPTPTSVPQPTRRPVVSPTAAAVATPTIAPTATP